MIRSICGVQSRALGRYSLLKLLDDALPSLRDLRCCDKGGGADHLFEIIDHLGVSFQRFERRRGFFPGDEG